ncbi:MAG: ABC transporter ATP-binding protein [bacterium]|nr:ABC transporter ATP-binding protein [bacterium]
MKNIKQIILIAKPLYKVMYLITFLIFIGAIIQQVSPIVSKLIVDEIVSNINIGQNGNLNTLILLLAISFIVGLVDIALSSVSSRMGDHLSGELEKFLSEKFYKKVLTLPQQYFDGEISGKIVNQLSRGITSIKDFINTCTNFFFPIIFQSIFTVIVLAYYNLQVAFFIAILFPIYIALSYISTKKWGERETLKNQIQDTTRGRVQESILNIKVVKMFLNELNELNFLAKNLKNSNDIYAKQSKTFHIFDFLRNLSLNVVLLIVNVIVFYNAFKGSLTIGEMVLIIQLVTLARRPLFAMSFILTRFQQAESGSKEFFEILNLKGEEDLDQKVKVVKLENPILKFENLNFSYEESKSIITNLNFEIGNFEKVALVGHSGAGKSTIVNLIMKFYKPESGKVFLNNKDYNDITYQQVRGNISMVFQDSELFSTNVKDNVSYGKENATEQEIIKALKVANAYDFVMGFEKGLDTQIGERGIKLSGGQKQRIQIARAVLHNSPILILDEATSSLDSASELEVQLALENLMKGKLVIIIAHRFSTIQNVDKVIVINQGQVEDIGTPKDLSVKPGTYQTLLQYQIQGNKKLLKDFDIY